MIGLEIGHADGSGPDPVLRDRIIDECFTRGLLLLPCGPSTVRFCPPLCLTKRQVEIGLGILGDLFEDVSSGKVDADQAVTN